MSGAAPVLREAVDRFAVIGALEYTADGEPHVVEAASDLEVTLARHLYRRVHTRVPEDFEEPSGSLRELEEHDLVATLQAEAGQRTYVDDGWVVVDRQQRLVAKESLVLRAAAGDIVVGPEELVDQDVVRLALPCERRFLVPGYYTRIGVAGPREAGRQLCVYLHVALEHACGEFNRMCRGLDSAGAPFVAKVLNNRALYRRADTMVVYAAVSRLQTVLAEAGRAPRSALLDPTPGFARRVSAGIAIGSLLPAAGERHLSFGEYCSLLVARGLVAAHRAGVSSRRGRLDEVAAAFAAEGVDPAFPDGES